MNLPRKLSIDWLRRAYLSGTVTPQEVVEACRKRAEAAAEYHAWIHLMTMEEIAPYLEALKEKPIAECPLWGIPFAIKDNIDLKGVPTTAGSPEYAYQPEQTAEIVRRVLAAGAIPLGKTNLDQFATGLVGTRSPYGEAHNALKPELISGGSSSGSAVAVAMGQAAFSFGTDTAGSGRVPAALHGLYGWKASIGAFPAHGVVPACRSLDCVSVFAHSLEDALTVDQCVRGFTELDPWSRALPMQAPQMPQHIYIAKLEKTDFFGPYAEQYEKAWEKAVERVKTLGIPVTEIDDAMFRDAAYILYGGPLVAERWAALGDFATEHPEGVFPVTLEVLQSGAGDQYSAAALFQAQHKLKAYQMETKKLLEGAVYLTPTCGGTWTRDQVRENPIDANTAMGRFTNHCNLLDLCAAAIPAGMAEKDVPFGITAFALCGEEHLVAGFAQKYEACRETIPLVVCGLHMRGMPLEHQMLELGAAFAKEIKTAPVYRMYALPETPERPGLVRVKQGGAAVEAEVWNVPADTLGGLIAGISAPLGFGKVQLSDGTNCEGFLCESEALDGAVDITEFGGFRNYFKSKTVE